MKLNYQRLVQWVSGPFSAAVGVLAAKAATHLSFLGNVGLGHDATAHAITNAVVFVTTSSITYAAHHKWLDNAAKWWVDSGMALPAGVEESDTAPNVPPSPTDTLRAQLRDNGIEPTA